MFGISKVSNTITALPPQVCIPRGQARLRKLNFIFEKLIEKPLLSFEDTSSQPGPSRRGEDPFRGWIEKVKR